MRQIEKLVQQIREALAEPGDLVAMQLLASQYAQHCQEANRRLGQCAEMIGRGNKYQTLQLAETKPSLLELVTTLSFDGQQEWRTLCRERALAIPEKIDEKGVRQLNDLYATGIPPTEEMWKVFRASISEGDDLKSLSIVRMILNRDGNDADARREVPRLEKKIVRAKMTEIKGSIERRDGADAVRLMSEIESVTPEPPDEEVWRAALDVRRQHFKAQAEKECNTLLRQTRETQTAGDWRAALGSLVQVQSLVAQHNLTLAPDPARFFSEAKAWAAKQQQQDADDQAWRESLSALEMQLNLVSDKEVAEKKRLLPELREDRVLIAKRWNELEQFRREVPAETVARLRRVLAVVKVEVDRIERGRKLRIGSVAALLLIALAAGGLFALRYWKAREFSRELSDALNGHRAAPVEKLLADLREKHGSLLHDPTLSARMTEADAWVADQHTREAGLESRIAALNAESVGTGFTKMPSGVLKTQLVQAREQLTPIAEDLRTPAEKSLAELDQAYEMYIHDQSGVTQEQFRDVLAKAEQIAAGHLEFTQPPEQVAAVLAQIGPLLATLDRLSSPSEETLKPSADDLDKLGRFKSRLAPFQEEADKLSATEHACASATTLDAYLKAVNGYATSPFLQSVSLRAARAVRESVKDLDSVTAGLLMPGDPAAWSYFKAHRSARTFFPGNVTTPEKTIFLGLRDEDNLRDIYRYEYANPQNNSGSPYLFSKGALTRFEATIGSADHKSVTMQGNVYLPWKSRTAVTFSPMTFKAEIVGAGRNAALPEKGGLSPESALFEQIELRSLVDEVVTKYQRSIFGVLDRLLAGAADPLFKAYIHTRLLDLAGQRPNDWGLSWTSGRAHARRLVELAPGLGSGDWMTPARVSERARTLAEFYNGLHGFSYAKQASVLSQITGRAYDLGFSYAGFLNAAGKPQLVAEGIDALELWGYSKEQPHPALLLRHAPGGGAWQTVSEGLPLTPLFFSKLDRQKALADACKAADLAPANPAIADGLPPFFSTK